MNDGTVRCWAGLSPPLNGGAPTGKPTAIEGVTDATALDVGAAHACALSRGGAVSCWGYNTQGQLDGKPSETFVWPPRRVDPPG